MRKHFVDHLLFVLGEECGEVQQVSGKAGRFGIFDINPKTKVECVEELRKEVHDIVATYRMLCKEIGMDSSLDEKLMAEKEERVKMYYAMYHEQPRKSVRRGMFKYLRRLFSPNAD